MLPYSLLTVVNQSEMAAEIYSKPFTKANRKKLKEITYVNDIPVIEGDLLVNWLNEQIIPEEWIAAHPVHETALEQFCGRVAQIKEPFYYALEAYFRCPVEDDEDEDDDNDYDEDDYDTELCTLSKSINLLPINQLKESLRNGLIKAFASHIRYSHPFLEDERGLNGRRYEDELIWSLFYSSDKEFNALVNNHVRELKKEVPGKFELETILGLTPSMRSIELFNPPLQELVQFYKKQLATLLGVGTTPAECP